ncbi:Aldo-keto reductase domain-containing protein [Forsythia ovata]|uniref:Aldo-keto reductase domain-containing protein n=1 Tax=Forsythia ovata TaxID=205694 RepID=A0ABD1NYA5_9LAMI
MEKGVDEVGKVFDSLTSFPALSLSALIVAIACDWILVSKLGYGCMGLSGNYNFPVPEEEGIAVIKEAFCKGFLQTIQLGMLQVAARQVGKLQVSHITFLLEAYPGAWGFSKVIPLVSLLFVILYFLPSPIRIVGFNVCKQAFREIASQDIKHYSIAQDKPFLTSFRRLLFVHPEISTSNDKKQNKEQGTSDMHPCVFKIPLLLSLPYHALIVVIACVWISVSTAWGTGLIIGPALGGFLAQFYMIIYPELDTYDITGRGTTPKWSCQWYSHDVDVGKASSPAGGRRKNSLSWSKKR